MQKIKWPTTIEAPRNLTNDSIDIRRAVVSGEGMLILLLVMFKNTSFQTRNSFSFVITSASLAEGHISLNFSVVTQRFGESQAHFSDCTFSIINLRWCIYEPLSLMFHEKQSASLLRKGTEDSFKWQHHCFCIKRKHCTWTIKAATLLLLSSLWLTSLEISVGCSPWAASYWAFLDSITIQQMKIFPRLKSLFC